MRIPLNTVAALDQITVPAPCPVSWDAMRADDQVRFCGHCRQHVYNLSEMTAAEAVQLIEAKQGRLCVQLFRRRDGTLITADCPVGWRWRFFKYLRRRMAWAASLFALVFLPGCPMGGGNMRQVVPGKVSIASKDPGSNSSPSSPK
jgi:hypothetical protein